MIDVETFAAGDFELAGVEPELLENGGVDVGHVVPILDGVESDLVGRSVHDSPFQPSAGHPDREAEDVMISSVRTLRTGGAAELGGEHDQRLVEQAAAVEILQQSADRLIHGQGVFGMVLLESAVRVPSSGTTGSVLDLDEPDAPFDEPPRGQQLHPKIATVRLIEPIQGLGLRPSRGRKSTTSGTDRCMRNASSYDAIRAAIAGIVGILDAAHRVQLPDQILANRLRCGGKRLGGPAEVERVLRIDPQRHGIMGRPEIVAVAVVPVLALARSR